MSTVTTHVLDAVHGRPAVGVAVRLEQRRDGTAVEIGRATTDADGRVRELGPDGLEAGHYRLVFSTGEWFGRQGLATFFPEVGVDVTVVEGTSHCHVPLLLSPFAYSTYRGS